MLVSKVWPGMSQYKLSYGETANGVHGRFSRPVVTVVAYYVMLYDIVLHIYWLQSAGPMNCAQLGHRLAGKPLGSANTMTMMIQIMIILTTILIIVVTLAIQLLYA